MTFDDWKASATRMKLDDYEQGADIRAFFHDDEDLPGEEVIVFGPDRSWLVPIPNGDGEAYFVAAGRFADRIESFDDAAEALWREHAKYEQDDAPEID